MEACDYDHEDGDLETAMDSSEVPEQTSDEPAREPDADFDMVSVRDIVSPEPDDKMSLPRGPDDDNASSRDDSQTKLGMASTAVTTMNAAAASSSLQIDHDDGSSVLAKTFKKPAKTGSCHSSGTKQAAKSVSVRPQTAPESDDVELTIKCSNGYSFTTSVNVAQTTVLKLKEIIQKQSGFSVQRQNLLFKGKTLNPDRVTLKSLKVSSGIIQVAEVNYGG